jgi:O-antigen ligase
VNPLLGVGPGNFGHYYERYWQANPGAHQLRVVHNSYLEIASEIGIPALVAFLAFYLTVFRRTGEVLQRATANATLLVALRVSMVIAAVAALFVSEQLAAPFWVLAGLASAICRNPGQRTIAT